MAAQKQRDSKTRRVFSTEFKIEAVQRAAERRAAGVPLTQIAREVGITAHQLRTWTRTVEARPGARPTDVFPD